jgi:hypothetical protein
MRKYILPSLLILACFAGGALSQNINRAIQLSQDPTGLVGYDTTNNVYFPNHILSTTRGGPPPVLSSCGTAPSFTGTDVSMKLTTGSAATTCTITFGTPFIVAPACLVVGNGSPAVLVPTYTSSTTALTITVDIASTVYSVLCMSTS